MILKLSGSMGPRAMRPGTRRRRVGRHRAVIGRHQEDVVGLAVQRDGARAGLGGQRLFNREMRGTVFLDHGQMTIAGRRPGPRWWRD